MAKACIAALAFLLVGAVVQAPTIANAAVLMILADDSDRDAVPKNSRIWMAFNGALTDRLMARNFKVLDGQMLLGPTLGHARKTPDITAVLKALKDRGTVVDFIVVIAINARVDRGKFTRIMRPVLRFDIRLFGHDSRNLGSFVSENNNLPPLRNNCNRGCLMKIVGRSAADQSSRIAEAIMTKLPKD